MAYIVAGWTVFLFFVWLPVEAAHSAFCFNNYDLGIYGQALALLSLENLNPYLSTRDIKIFNDHFDPILFLIAPMAKLVEPSLLAIRVELAAIVLASAAPVWLWWNRLIAQFEMAAVFLLILFSPMTLMAAFYPSHPGTWALAPLAWMFAALYAGRDRLAIIMLLLLLACKEEFPVVSALLGAILIVQDRKRVGFLILVISVVWFCAVFFLRPIFLGKSDYYTSAMMTASGLASAESDTWLLRLLELVILIFTPFLLLRSRKTFGFNLLKKNSWLIICAFVALAFLAIRVIGGYWGNHRAAPLAVIAGFIIIGNTDHAVISQRLRRVLFCIFLLGAAAPGLELGGRVWINKPFKKHCPSSPDRIQALNDVVSYLETVNADRVLAGGNLVPHLVRRPGVAQIGATKSDDFKFFVVEKYQHRNAWPLNSAELQRIEDEWRSRPGVNLLRDDDYILLLKWGHPTD